MVSIMRLHGLERRIAGISRVLLEQQHLLAQVARGLAGKARAQHRGISLALRPMAGHALGGRGAAPRDRGGIDRHGRGPHLLLTEERGDLVHAEDEHHLGIGLHLG